MSADVVLDLLAATPGVAEDQMLGFGRWSGEVWTGFGWSQPRRFDDSIRRRHRQEFGCRLLTFSEATTRRLAAEGKSGGLDDAGYALGLLVDVDSNQRRLCWPEDPAGWSDDSVRRFYAEDEACEFPAFREYPPTISRALALVYATAFPTVVLDGGGGVPCAFLFDAAVPVADVGATWLSRLARRFLAVFGEAVLRDGWYFDSPPPLTSWLRLPGSRRARYDGHRVAVIDAAGPRYSLEDIEEIAGPDDGKPLRSFGYWDESEMTTWDGAPIPRPSPHSRTRSAPWWSPPRKKGAPWWTARS